jgi:hypothetical protein
MKKNKSGSWAEMKKFLFFLTVIGMLGAFDQNCFGYEEIGKWELVQPPITFTTLPYFISDENIWIARGGDIYNFRVGEWEKEDPVPNIGGLAGVAVVTSDKRWAIGGDGRILEYDGVFWNIVPNVDKLTSGGIGGRSHSISIIDENEVWFANGYRYKNGSYDKVFTESNKWFRSIIMIDSKNGVAICSDENIYVYADTLWIDTGIKASNIALDDDLGLWFISNGNLNYVDSISMLSAESSPVVYDPDPYNAISVSLDEEGDVWFTVYSTRSSNYYIGRLDRKNAEFDFFRVRVLISGSAGMGIPELLQFTPNWAWCIVKSEIDGWSRRLAKGSFISPSLVIPNEIRFEDLSPSEFPEINGQLRSNLIIKNTGEGILKIRDISSDSEIFRFQAESSTRRYGDEFNFTSGEIRPDDSLRVVVVYLPTEPGQHSGTITIESNDRENPIFEINLSGATRGSIGPQLEIDSAIAFPNTHVTEDEKINLVIKNNGAGILTITSITSSDPAFQVPSDSLSISSQDSLSIEISFFPDSQGIFAGTLSITSNDPVNPVVQVELTGEGVLPPLPQPSSMTIRANPSIPTNEDETTITISGTFPASNVAVTSQSHSIIGDLIAIEIATEWIGETVNAADTVSTSWSTEESIGILELGTYQVTIDVNGTDFMSSFTVKDPNAARGLIKIDFDLAEDDQQQRVAGNAAPGQVYDLQLYMKGGLDITGWSIIIEYDPLQVRYASNSFTPSDFIPNFVPLVDAQEGNLSLGGAVLGTTEVASGRGALGTLSFEILEGFSGSANLVIVENNFRFEGGGSEKYQVFSIATITDEFVEPPIQGDFDGNGKVDFTDFFAFADAFGGSDSQFDLNKSGSVDFDDFFIFADNFGKNL